MKKLYDKEEIVVCSNCGKSYKRGSGQFRLYSTGGFKDKSCRKCRTVVAKNSYRRNYPYNYYKITYNLSYDDYKNILEKQGGVCAICKKNKTDSIGRGLCLDHSHNNKLIRGFLCKNCNLALGLFEDNIEILKSAISYLKN